MKSGPYKNKLKHYLDLTGLTQAELSKRLVKRGFKATPAYVSQIQAGLKHIPYGLAVAICEELGFEAKMVTDIFLPQYFTASEENGQSA